jgi:phosphatidylglycerol:prolipoprotein diacylglycerol transferase
MIPILFRIGSYTAYSYTYSLALGILLGAWVTYQFARTRLSHPAMVLDAGFWGLLGGILGGRAGYVLANWAYFCGHVDKALDLKNGGLSWHGALLGGGLVVSVWLVVRKRLGHPVPDWRDLLDAAAPGLAVGSALGWLGCLLTGAGYGAEAAGHAPPLSWLTAYLPDIYGVEDVRFLTQPLMIAWSILLAISLWALRRWMPRGAAFAHYLLLYALGDLLISFLRGDGTWRLGLWLWQWFALAEMVIALVLGIYAYTRERKESSSAGEQGARHL